MVSFNLVLIDVPRKPNKKTKSIKSNKKKIRSIEGTPIKPGQDEGKLYLETSYLCSCGKSCSICLE